MKPVFLLLLILSTSARALEGIASLESLIYKKNLDYQAQINFVESKQALSKSGYSGFYPTLNAVGGYGQNKTDDLAVIQKGYLGYLEGRANLFRGFKDQALADQKNIDAKLSALDLEFKKRDLRLQLTEVVSDMIYLHGLQDVLQEELKVTLSQRQMAAKKVSAGLTGSVDNLELDLRENEIEIEIKQIDQLHSENHQKLVKLFGEDLKDSELDQVSFSEVSKIATVSKEMRSENSLSVQKAELLKSKYESEKSEAKSDFLPSLDLTYSVGRLTPSEESPTKFNESKYGIVLTVPLFSGLETYYKSKSATQQIAAADKLRYQAQIDVDSEFKILKSKIDEKILLNSINNKKLNIAQKYFELTLGEYRRGIKNSPDLVSATDRLFSSKKKKFELLKDLEILKIKLENIY